MRHVLLTTGMMAALLASALIACGKCAAQPEQAPAAQAQDKDSKAVVTVNGEKITEATVNEELNKRIEVMKQRMGGQAMPEAQKQQMRKRVVDMMVDQVLLEQKLKAKNLSVSDEKVMDEIKKIAGQQGQSMEDVEKEIQQWGMTLNDLKSQLRMKLMMDALIEAESKDAVATAEDVKKFYDENPQHFDQPEQVKASHILIKVDPEATPEAKAEAKKKLEDILKQVKEGGDFAALAKEHSACPSGAQGGDLGSFGRGQMVKEFEEVAFSMKPGDVSGIVETQFGYHIIKVTEKKEAGKVPFDEVKEQIEAYLTQQKRGEFWQNYSQKMREEAKIEFSAEEKQLRDQAEEAASKAAPSMKIQPQIQPAEPAEPAEPQQQKPEEQKQEKPAEE
jgi:peptidyl-prolyl cis-trans isomerase C